MKNVATSVFQLISTWGLKYNIDFGNIESGIEITKDKAYQKLVDYNNVLILDCKNDLEAKELYQLVSRLTFKESSLSDKELLNIISKFNGSFFYIGTKS